MTSTPLHMPELLQASAFVLAGVAVVALALGLRRWSERQGNRRTPH